MSTFFLVLFFSSLLFFFLGGDSAFLLLIFIFIFAFFILLFFHFTFFILLFSFVLLFGFSCRFRFTDQRARSKITYAYQNVGCKSKCCMRSKMVYVNVGWRCKVFFLVFFSFFFSTNHASMAFGFVQNCRLFGSWMSCAIKLLMCINGCACQKLGWECCMWAKILYDDDEYMQTCCVWWAEYDRSGKNCVCKDEWWW